MKYKKETVKDFWNENCMNYDWEKTSQVKEGSPEFFRRIDSIIFNEHRFAEKNGRPFGKYIPFKYINGKKVLEVGCGMGTMAQLMALHGAEVTAIDLTPRAIANTKKRFALLKRRFPKKTNIRRSRILEADAEHLPFKDNTFDFILSWGVIHHSPKTPKALAEIYRVLKEGGVTSGMIYHRRSIVFWGHYVFLRGVLMGKLLKYNVEELANRYSDGYQVGGCPKAEHFTKGQWKKLMQTTGFTKGKITAAGMTTDLYPPGTRKILNRIVPRSIPELILRAWGWFLIWDKWRKPRKHKK